MIAVNWNTQEDMTNMFWRQNISQMWVETEFKVSKTLQVGRLYLKLNKTHLKSISWFNRLRYTSSR